MTPRGSNIRRGLRWTDQTLTPDLLHRHGPAWRAIFADDAAMSPYEITHPGGATAYRNAESDATWLARAFTQWLAHL